jgi:hypothetical protein
MWCCGLQQTHLELQERDEHDLTDVHSWQIHVAEIIQICQLGGGFLFYLESAMKHKPTIKVSIRWNGPYPTNFNSLSRSMFSSQKAVSLLLLGDLIALFNLSQLSWSSS